ncbi:hypothetical protein FRC12_015876, partial [Ceratobasidium sp. 428]
SLGLCPGHQSTLCPHPFRIFRGLGTWTESQEFRKLTSGTPEGPERRRSIRTELRFFQGF